MLINDDNESTLQKKSATTEDVIAEFFHNIALYYSFSYLTASEYL